MKKKILVIDDQPSFGEMIKVNLEDQGQYEVDTALNGEEGIRKVKAGTFDVIFLDLIMPKVEGHTALREIKKISPSPVIIMSAFIPPHVKQEIIKAGAFACLEKPVNLQRILDVIQSALGSKA